MGSHLRSCACYSNIPNRSSPGKSSSKRIWSKDIYRFMAPVKEISVEADVAEQAAVQIPISEGPQAHTLSRIKIKGQMVSENQEHQNIGEKLP
jgi:hypothetical protein